MLDADSAPAPAQTDGQQQRANDTGIMKDSNGWDGKLRVERNAVITNPEAVEDPDYSDEDAPPVEQIEADEGTCRFRHLTDWSGGRRFQLVLWSVSFVTDVSDPAQIC